MALFAQKALQFVRAPDENVFIARKCFILKTSGGVRPFSPPFFVPQTLPSSSVFFPLIRLKSCVKHTGFV